MPIKFYINEQKARVKAGNRRVEDFHLIGLTLLTPSSSLLSIKYQRCRHSSVSSRAAWPAASRAWRPGQYLCDGVTCEGRIRAGRLQRQEATRSAAGKEQLGMGGRGRKANIWRICAPRRNLRFTIWHQIF